MPRRSKRALQAEAEAEVRIALGPLAGIPEEPPEEVSDEALAQFIIPIMLDADSRLTRSEIARQVGQYFHIDFNLQDLQRLQESETWARLWPLSENPDPRIQVARHEFANLVLIAVQELKNLLIAPETPATAKMRAIEKILKLAGVEDDRPPSNAGELEKWLGQLGVGQMNQINIGTLIAQVVPREVLEAGEIVARPTHDRNLTGVGMGGLLTAGENDDESDTIDGELVE